MIAMLESWTACGRRARGSLRSIPGADRLRRWRRARTLRDWRRRLDREPAALGRFAVELRVALPEGVDWAPYEAASPRIRCVLDPPLDAQLTWIYAPDRREGLLEPDELSGLVLALAHDPLDFVVVSRGADLASPALASVRNGVVFAADAWRAWRQTGSLPPGARGRIVRLPLEGGGRACSIGALGLGRLARDGAALMALPRPRDGACAAPTAARVRLLPASSSRPVLVLPAELAVGGVERNLVTVIEALRGRRHFVVATTERLADSVATLRQAVRAAGGALYEIGELVAVPDRMRVLETLAEEIQPELVWICNGSPWLLAHAAALRRCFADVPIVAQQTYDDREGWIEFYADPALRSFDRYVAVNARIRDALVRRAGIAPSAIDEIPPALDSERFCLARADAARSAQTRARFGLPEGVRCFAQIGRLTEQKRPLTFLALARRAREAGLPDRFVLVGDGPLAARCDAFLAKHRLGNALRIPFCADPSELVSQLDGVILASAYEGMPLVLLEAAALGVPILTTDTGDAAALLGVTGGGLVVPRIGADPAAWRDFERWRASLDELRAHARAGAAGVAVRYGAPAVADAYDRCFSAARRTRAR